MPDANLDRESFQQDILRVLTILSDRESRVVQLYFGLNGNPALTLEEIGAIFDLTRENVRQIKERAIRKMKKPLRARLLAKYR